MRDDRDPNPDNDICPYCGRAMWKHRERCPREFD